MCTMSSGVLSEEEKESILKTIEADRKFRHALMGLLGYTEVLERFARLEERQQSLEERQQRLEERQQRLEERFSQLEERFARLEERQQRLEERFAQLEERFARLEERQQRLEERFAQLEERFLRIESALLEFKKTVAAIAHRFGVMTEESFREAMKYVVEEVLGTAKVERWVYRDSEGIVYGYPSMVEIDLVVRDTEHILVEVKSRVDRSDVRELHRIGELYEKVVGVKPRMLIIGGFVEQRAYEAAEALNVEVKPTLRE